MDIRGLYSQYFSPVSFSNFRMSVVSTLKFVATDKLSLMGMGVGILGLGYWNRHKILELTNQAKTKLNGLFQKKVLNDPVLPEEPELAVKPRKPYRRYSPIKDWVEGKISDNRKISERSISTPVKRVGFLADEPIVNRKKEVALDPEVEKLLNYFDSISVGVRCPPANPEFTDCRPYFVFFKISTGQIKDLMQTEKFWITMTDDAFVTQASVGLSPDCLYELARFSSLESKYLPYMAKLFLQIQVEDENLYPKLMVIAEYWNNTWFDEKHLKILADKLDSMKKHEILKTFDETMEDWIDLDKLIEANNKPKAPIQAATVHEVKRSDSLPLSRRQSAVGPSETEKKSESLPPSRRQSSSSLSRVNSGVIDIKRNWSVEELINFKSNVFSSGNQTIFLKQFTRMNDNSLIKFLNLIRGDENNIAILGKLLNVRAESVFYGEICDMQMTIRENLNDKERQIILLGLP